VVRESVFFTKGLNKNKVDPIKRNGFLIHLVKRSPISVENSIRKKFIPPQAWERDLLTLWRERIISPLFFFWAVFAPFALIPSLILSFNEVLWSVFILDSVAYVIVVVVLLSKKFSLKQKTWIAF